MDSSKSSGGMKSNIVYILVTLVILYYLYQFLYSPSDLIGSVVLSQISTANPDTPYDITNKASGNSPALPVIYEGGEYSINTWIYINDYSINRGQNKHVLSLGGNTFSTLALFLGPYNNSLSVRVQTNSLPSTGNQDNLSAKSLTSMFTTLQTESSLLNPNKPCDINTIDIQKWVQVSIVLNNKTCDVYMDGKLARSCILPSFYRVDKVNMKLTICDHKGFGGFISNTSAYNYALNPEQVWRLYMSGPGPQYTLWQYITSLFNTKQAMTFDYPKQNITG